MVDMDEDVQLLVMTALSRSSGTKSKTGKSYKKIRRSASKKNFEEINRKAIKRIQSTKSFRGGKI